MTSQGDGGWGGGGGGPGAADQCFTSVLILRSVDRCFASGVFYLLGHVKGADQCFTSGFTLSSRNMKM